jgi:ADP-ribose pyrophosphatase YjhB (NUDIX family)
MTNIGNSSILHIVAAIIRRGNEILLVEQQGANDPAPSWALPGGRVEPGELLIDTLVREVREETGLAVAAIGQLAYLVQAESDHRTLVLMFEVKDWSGEIRVNDPDGYILQARFAPQSDAIALLEKLPLRHMHEPLVSYLRGEAKPGALWFYRRQPDGNDVLITQLNSER